MNQLENSEEMEKWKKEAVTELRRRWSKTPYIAEDDAHEAGFTEGYIVGRKAGQAEIDTLNDWIAKTESVNPHIHCDATIEKYEKEIQSLKRQVEDLTKKLEAENRCVAVRVKEGEIIYLKEQNKKLKSDLACAVEALEYYANHNNYINIPETASYITLEADGEHIDPIPPFRMTKFVAGRTARRALAKIGGRNEW